MMKYILIFCSLFFASFDVSYGQAVEKISIPVLKEDSKVDKLMDIVLGPKKNGKSTQRVKDQDSSYTIELFKGDDGSYAYQIKKVKKTVVNTLINQRINRLDFGYFQYRKYHIIVWTNTDFSDLINKTSQVTTLNFVYKLQTIPSLKSPYDLATWHYMYNKGQFDLEDSPPPMN